MNDIELLDLISKGDTENLLLQNNLTERLNFLASRGLIDICGGGIHITEKGSHLYHGKNILLFENPEIKKEPALTVKYKKKDLGYFYLYLILSFSLAILIILMLS